MHYLTVSFLLLIIIPLFSRNTVIPLRIESFTITRTNHTPGTSVPSTVVSTGFPLLGENDNTKVTKNKPKSTSKKKKTTNKHTSDDAPDSKETEKNWKTKCKTDITWCTKYISGLDDAKRKQQGIPTLNAKEKKAIEAQCHMKASCVKEETAKKIAEIIANNHGGNDRNSHGTGPGIMTIIIICAGFAILIVLSAIACCCCSDDKDEKGKNKGGISGKSGKGQSHKSSKKTSAKSKKSHTRKSFKKSLKAASKKSNKSKKNSTKSKKSRIQLPNQYKGK